MGRDLDGLDGASLDRAVASTSVYARVTPEHKLRIVARAAAAGEIVAMTGDGVNDAPALKRADIGVAMGVTAPTWPRGGRHGAAGRQLRHHRRGRRRGAVIYDNIRKFIKYLLATNAGELWVMLLGPLFGLPLPLLPLQILWINLVTDGLPGAGLVRRNVPSGTLWPARRGDRRRACSATACCGTSGGWACSSVDYVWDSASGAGRAGNPAWQSMVFTTLALLQIAHVLAIRVERGSVLGRVFFANRALLGSALLLVGLQLAVLYMPWLQAVFATVPLSGPSSWLASSSVRSCSGRWKLKSCFGAM